MDTRERILLPLHPERRAGEPMELAVDVAPLFLHLLLFDTVILRSVRLTDVSGLVRAIGGEQTVELLDAGCVQIRVGVDHIGSYGSKEPIVRLINLFVPDPEAELSQAMDEAFSPLGLSKPVKKRLKLAVVRRRLTTEPAHKTFGLTAVQEAFREAVANSDVFKRALKFSAAKHGHGININDGVIHAEIVDGNLRFDARGVDGDQDVAANVIRHACLAISKLNTEFGWMKRDNAITALDEDSTVLMETKFEFLWRGHDPQSASELWVVCSTRLICPTFARS
jgi:hypothetical protein